MQICDILIRISPTESSNTTIGRQNVTPAEVVVLRHMKGPNSVIFNGNLRVVKRTSAAEGQRLQAVHGSSFAELFPGMTPTLPQDFGQVEFDTSHVPVGDPYVPAPDESPILEDEVVEEGAEEGAEEVVVAVKKAPSKGAAKKAAKKRETFE